MNRGYCKGNYIYPFLVIWVLVVFLVGCQEKKASKKMLDQQEHIENSALIVEGKNMSVVVAINPELDEIEVGSEFICAGRSIEEAEERLSRAQLVMERNKEQALIIRPLWVDPMKKEDRVELYIQLPSVNGVFVKTSYGEVFTEGTAGDLQISTTYGDVVVEKHQGLVQVKNIEGDVDLQSIQGACDVVGEKTNVTISEARGFLKVLTTEGFIKVFLKEEEVGPLDLSTTQGNVLVEVGKAFSGKVDMEASRGKIFLKDPSGKINIRKKTSNMVDFVLGEANQISRIKTQDGDIEFKIEETK